MIPKGVKISRQKRSLMEDKLRWVIFYRKDAFKDEETLWDMCTNGRHTNTSQIFDNVFASAYYDPTTKSWGLHYTKGNFLKTDGHKSLKDVWTEILTTYL